MAATDPFIGIPHREFGRDRSGADCYGLGVLLYRECLGIHLPEHGEVSPKDRAAVTASIDEARPSWVRISSAEVGFLDLILFKWRPWHMGFLVGRGSMLHMPEGARSRIERYDTGRFPEPEGFYRHVARTSP